MVDREPPASGAESEPRVFQWQEIMPEVATLKAGDMVQGFERDLDVDRFVTVIGDVLRERRPRTRFDPERDYSLNNSGFRVYDGWHSNSKPPSRAMKPPKFYGKLQNFEVVILQDIDTPTIDYLDHRTVRIGLFADMFSTGRGVVGKVAKECTVGTTVPPEHRWKHTAGRLITSRYRNIRELHNAEKVAAELNLQASEMATKVIVNGLRRVYYGGLPGRGKRR